MDDIKFKIPGKKGLLTYNELMAFPNKCRVKTITVVDLKSQRNYKTGLVTIMRKFR